MTRSSLEEQSKGSSERVTAPKRFESSTPPDEDVKMDQAEVSPTPEQEFGYMQIRRQEYLDMIEGLVPQQQTLALAGAVFDLGEQVTEMDKGMKKMERRMDKRMDMVENKLDEVLVELKRMYRRRAELLAEEAYDEGRVSLIILGLRIAYSGAHLNRVGVYVFAQPWPGCYDMGRTVCID
ncbi:hypothetical protein K440DRAFT_642778 [Wilcoxina mikolae CBS 423.85]|nr:hypothetical protein K440DRAFT_642778 [Wilcoxina mikolae CBS 423.85]